MITNSELTIYHKGLDTTTKLEKWTRFNYDKVWVFGGKGAGINKGYVNANDIDIRIPYADNEGLDITNFGIEDIIVGSRLDDDIQTSKDLKDYEIYHITSINNNDFGSQPHIHLGGK